MCKVSLKSAASLCAAVCAGALFFVYNKAAVIGVRDGLLLCARTVVPSLFPFMVISSLIIKNEYSALLGLAFYPYVRLLGIKSKAAACAVMLSLLGGFAVAASLISSLYEAGGITKRDAGVLLCCCVGSSPAFVISAVGAGILGSVYVGVIMFAALTAASLICGAVFSLFYKERGVGAYKCLASNKSGGFAEALRSSVFSVLAICGYVVFFSFLLAVLSGIKPLLPYSGIIALLLEPANACRLLNTPYMCCAALSLCGLSVLLQVRCLLGSDISLAPFIASRTVHLPLSLLIMKLLLALFPSAVQTAAINIFPRKTYTHMPADAIAAVFILLCFVFCRAPLCSLRNGKNSV